MDGTFYVQGKNKSTHQSAEHSSYRRNGTYLAFVNNMMRQYWQIGITVAVVAHDSVRKNHRNTAIK